MEDLPQLIEDLDRVDGVAVERWVASGDYSTYRVGGPLGALARVSSAAALVELASLLVVREIPTLAIGRGSNLLVSDAGFEGLAIHLTDSFASLEIDGTVVTAGAAADLPRVARATVRAGLTGFEWAVGVPGSIGGAVRMNAGGHGSDMAASLTSIEMIDLHLGGLVIVPVDSLDLAYRHSNLEPWQIVASATLELEKLVPETGEPGAGTEAVLGEQLISEIVAWRREHQPGGANAGSVFTNPPDDSAGRLIDASGLKGHRIGTAAVSDKHANFIQADPGGKADDIVELMLHIVDEVQTSQGVRLQAETRLVGFDPGVTAALGVGESHPDSTASALVSDDSAENNGDRVGT